MNEIISLELFPAPDFLLGMGTSGRLVTGLQLILQALGEKYRNFPQVRPEGIYDESTRLAVIFLQQRAGLKPTGVVDLATWNHMARLYNFSAKVFFDNQIHNS